MVDFPVRCVVAKGCHYQWSSVVVLEALTFRSGELFIHKLPEFYRDPAELRHFTSIYLPFAIPPFFPGCLINSLPTINSLEPT